MVSCNVLIRLSNEAFVVREEFISLFVFGIVVARRKSDISCSTLCWAFWCKRWAFSNLPSTLTNAACFLRSNGSRSDVDKFFLRDNANGGELFISWSPLASLLFN